MLEGVGVVGGALGRADDNDSEGCRPAGAPSPHWGDGKPGALGAPGGTAGPGLVPAEGGGAGGAEAALRRGPGLPAAGAGASAAAAGCSVGQWTESWPGKRA
jgi:hypothetical protein